MSPENIASLLALLAAIKDSMQWITVWLFWIFLVTCLK